MIRLISYVNAQPGDETGTALAEWALLVVLIAIVAIVGVAISGGEVSGQYSNIASAVDSAG
jgi:Flp pilus assembly pilin Flp